MYGYPMPEAEAAAKRGKIELGGCVISYCKACGERFDFPPTAAARRTRIRK
jgi:hypothetical protein